MANDENSNKGQVVIDLDADIRNQDWLKTEEEKRVAAMVADLLQSPEKAAIQSKIRKKKGKKKRCGKHAAP